MRQLRPVSQGSSTLGRLSTLDRVSCRLRALEPSGALGCAGLNVMAGKLSAGVTEDAETLPGVPAPLLSSRLRREVGAAPATHTPRRPGSRRASPAGRPSRSRRQAYPHGPPFGGGGAESRGGARGPGSTETLPASLFAPESAHRVPELASRPLLAPSVDAVGDAAPSRGTPGSPGCPWGTPGHSPPRAGPGTPPRPVMGFPRRSELPWLSPVLSLSELLSPLPLLLPGSQADHTVPPPGPVRQIREPVPKALSLTG